MAKHSKIGASSMDRWSACPASVRLSEGMPNRSSVHAEEGTFAHGVAAKWLLTKHAPKIHAEPGVFDGEPRIVSQEILDAVKVYVDAVRAESATKEWIEEKFDLSSLHPGLYGTSDCIQWLEKEKLLRVWDYKHGAGIFVEVERNVQLLYYALGALLKTKVPANEVEIIVCQPRCTMGDAIRRWRFKSAEILDFAADLVEAAKATEDPFVKPVPGEHCRFCPAAPICPAVAEKAAAEVKAAFADSSLTASAITTYSPEKLSELLKFLDSVDAWAASVREFAYSEATAGRPPPGFKLVQKQARRKWKNESEAAIALGKRIPHDELFEPRKIKSVAQAEKYLPKAERGILNDLVIAESSGTVLVPESDKRPALSESIKAQFEIIEQPKLDSSTLFI